MKLDKILDFLFRTHLGRVALLGGLMMGAFMFSGCLCIDMVACACDPSCGGCWSECDDACNSCVLDCFGSDCAVIGCLFGDGCVSTCGDCVIDCGGCNTTMCTECDAGCDDGRGNCGLSCFNCVVSCDGNSQSSSNSGCGGCSGVSETETKTITITFYNQDGQVVRVGNSNTTPFSYRKGETPSQIDTYNTSIDQFYEFDGYFFDSAFLERATDAYGNWTSEVEIEYVTELYGKLTETHYKEERTIKFRVEPSGVSASYQPVKVTVGGTLTLPEPIEVDGYQFRYWETKAGKTFYESEVKAGIVFHLIDWVSKNDINEETITVTAVYAPAKYEMTFNFGGNTVAESFEYMTTLSQATSVLKSKYPNYFEQNGMQFVGWSKDRGATYPTADLLFDDYRIKKSETLYAVFSHSITVTLHYTKGPDNDDTIVLGTKAEGESLSLSEYRPENHLPYLFEGWYSDPGYNNRVSSSSIIVSADTANLYAHWTTKLDYNIYYYLNTQSLRTSGYTMNNSSPIGLADENDISALNKQGYRFDGWCRQQDLSDQPIKELPAGTFGDQYLYAKLTPKTYTIHMNLTDGASMSQSTTVSVTYNESYDLHAPTRTDYDFRGWKTDSGKTITGTDGKSLKPFTMDTIGKVLSDGDTLEVYADWTEHKYTVKFTVDGQVVASGQYVKNQQIGTPAGLTDPTKKGYDFKGWYCGGTLYSSDLRVQGDMTFEADFDPKQYKVTLDGHGGLIGGESSEMITIEYGDTPDLSQYIPTMTGYTFVGWAWDPNGTHMLTGKDGKFTEPFDGEHLTLYAIWE